MNPPSKVPPRFVPTLTEVVPSASAEDAAEPQRAEPELDPAQSQVQAEDESGDKVASTSPLASFHSPWLADGLYVRSRPATIPHDLPPLPESLPPQQPFASTSAVATNDAEAEAHKELLVEPEPGLSTQAEVTEEIEPVVEVGQAVRVSEQIYAEPDRSEAETLVWNEEAPQVTEEYLVHRLMQRVDLVLEQRLKEAIASVVQEQTRSLLPRLREEVESVVRQSVYEAVESELSQQNKPRPEN